MGALAPETRTRRLIVGNLAKFLEDSKFFWTEYHSGKINIILHLVGFSFLFYGLAYFFVHNRDRNLVSG
ncbi:MAG: hypothetical protein WB723_11685 [Candidatus Acidiferrales bacterium]